MKKLIIFISLCFLLSSCSFFQVHRMDVDQGNIFTDKQVAQLHKGQSTHQVKAIMGNPVLVNIFTPGHIEYVYTFKEGNELKQEKRVVCRFKKGVLVSVNRYRI